VVLIPFGEFYIAKHLLLDNLALEMHLFVRLSSGFPNADGETPWRLRNVVHFARNLQDGSKRRELPTDMWNLDIVALTAAAKPVCYKAHLVPVQRELEKFSLGVS
jgi:hypothetical protein